MTAAVYESDIDRFIKDRKSRLAQERRTLSDDGNKRETSRSPDSKRRQWDRSGLGEHKLAEQTHPRPPSAGERTGLSIGSKDAELKKHQMQVERNREYNELMKKKQPPNRRRPASPSTPMARQRVQEASKPAPAPAQAKASERPPENYESPRQQVIPISIGREKSISNPRIYPYDHERTNFERKKRLEQERRRDYREYIIKKELSPKRKPITPVEDMGLPVGQYEATKRKLQNEIKKEYREMLAQQQEEHDRLMLLQLSLAGEVDLASDNEDPAIQGSPVPEDIIKGYSHHSHPHREVPVFNQYQNKQQNKGETIHAPHDSGHLERKEGEFEQGLREVLEHGQFGNDLLQHYEDEQMKNRHRNVSDTEKRETRQQWLVSQRDKQLVNLETIHHREENLRRKLDEDKLRESDQENTLREETWRRHKGAQINVPQDIGEIHPAYFRAGDYERFRQKLNEDRRKEYNDLIKKKQQTDHQPQYYKAREEREQPATKPDASRLDTYGPYSHRTEGRKDYVPPRQKLEPRVNRRIWREPSSDESTGLKIGEYQRKKEELAAQRRQDMQQTLNKNQPSQRRQWKETDHTGLKFATQNPTAKFNEEKRQEYNEALKKKPQMNRNWREPSANGAVLFVGERERALEQLNREKLAKEKPKTEDVPRRLWKEPSSETGLNVGQYEEKRKALAEERRKEYEQARAEKAYNGGSYELWKQPSTETGLPLGEYETTKRKYQAERQREYNEFLAQKPPQSNRRIWREPSDSSVGLDFRKYDWNEKYRRKQKENQPTYDNQSYINRGSQTWRGTPRVPPLYFGSREEELERLAQTEREYRDLMNQLKANDRQSGLPPKPGTPGGFMNRLGRDMGKRREELSDERRREYNQLLAKKSSYGAGGRADPGSYGASIPGMRGADSAKYYYPERPKSDSEIQSGTWSKPWFERERSYVDYKPFSLEKMKKRNEEYNEFLREKEGQKRPRDADKHGHLRQPPGFTDPEFCPVTALIEHNKQDGTFATLPGLNYDNPKSLQSEFERNREYNEFLKRKAAQELIRIRSQGQDVPPDAPRKGWATPTYEEILEKKRQEEARYRRDDLDYRGPGLRSYGSEGALNGIDGQRRGKDLDKELDKRLRFDEGHRSILDDPLWLSPRRGENFDKAYSTAPISRLRDYNFKEAELSSPPRSPKPKPKPKPIAGGEGGTKYEEPQRRDPDPPHPRNRDPGYYATLPVGEQRDRRSRSDDDGNEERFSAQQRRKEQYRKELQQQMQEAYEAKRREKMEEMRVNASGANDPAKRGQGASSAPPPHLQPQVQPIQVVQAPVYKIADPAPVYTTRVANYDKLSPRSELVLGRKSLYTGNNQWDQIQQLDRINFDLDRQRYTAPSGSTEGILDKGFQSLLEPPRVSSLQPPPGLEYQPSTFVTGGGGMSPMDETYHYLATKNPLDPEIAGASQPRVAVVAQAGAAPGPSVAAGGATRVRFDDGGGRRQPPGGGATYAVEGDDDKARSRAKAQAYQAELARQIEEDKMKKAKAKADQEWYDMKLEREAKDYNPYGKGGGGAPMKDDRGNIMADLRAMKKGYTTGAGYSAFSASPRPPSPRDDKINTPPTQTTALGEVSHARGGHGIFGMPKTEAEKHQSDVYKDDLRRQIEAKKAAAAMERERERYEEEREARRIEAERKKMQDEYEEERKKIKQKEDEARRKNEELMRQAEERKREAEQRRRDAEDERRRQQEEADRERLERELQQAKAERGSSPPVPAVTRKQATEPESSDNTHASRVTSPPVPAARKKSASNSRPQSAARQPSDAPEEPYVPSALTHRVDAPLLERGQSPAEAGPSSHRAPSADILNALARMKHQLASERDRVENMLDRNDNEPEVFDPRLAQRPPPVPRVHHDIDVFERARNRNTVPVRRAPTVQEHPPNPDHLHEFNTLKQADTDSRQEFKRHYPYDPMSNDTLEQQQAALIRQQEAGLRAMRDKIQSSLSMVEEEGKYEKALPNMEPKDLGLTRHHTISPQPMLQSNSAFIDMNGLGPVFPDDLDDLPRRNDSARQRRRDRLFSSPRPGSVTSLDVDQIARKNEQRLKKLRDMQGDDLSMNDPDDVLDRFVSKQSHNRDFVTELDSETETFTPFKSDYAG